MFKEKPRKILFVCLGNICRSPSAEGVFHHILATEGATDLGLTIDSAGTSGYHSGNRADSRMRAAAEKRGYTLESRSRQFIQEDFDRFDLILGMDDRNVRDMREMARTDEEAEKVMLFTDFCPELGYDGVPDPYYGGERGFEEVLDICEAGCRGLLAEIR